MPSVTLVAHFKIYWQFLQKRVDYPSKFKVDVYEVHEGLLCNHLVGNADRYDFNLESTVCLNHKYVTDTHYTVEKSQHVLLNHYNPCFLQQWYVFTHPKFINK